MSVKGPEIFDKFVGESEKTIRELFRKARQSQPSIVYFDEFDAIASSRGGSDGGYGNYGSVGAQVVNQILVEMDGIEDRKGVVVVASTNKLELVDKAMLRPGRFDRIVYVPNPQADSRYEVLKVHTKKMPLTDEAKEYLKVLANITDHFSGADLENVCREAGMQAIREKLEDFSVIEKKHFEAALKKTQPSLSDDIIKYYEEQAKVVATMRAVTDGKGLYS